MGSLGMGVIVIGMDKRIRDVNDHFSRITNNPKEALVGKDALEIIPSMLGGEVARKVITVFTQAFETGMTDTRPMLVTIPRNDGTEALCSFTSSFITDGNGEPDGILGVMVDVSEADLAREVVTRHRLLVEGINEILREGIVCGTEEELAEKCLAVAERLTCSGSGFIAELNDGDGLDLIANSDPGWEGCWKPGSVTLDGMDHAVVSRDIWETVIGTGTPLMMNRPAERPESGGTPEDHPGITSFLGVPLRYRDEIVGMMAVGNKVGGYIETDREALEDLSMSFMEALYSKRADIEMAGYRDRLEELVKERTAVIVENQNQFLTILDNFPEMLFVVDPSTYEILFANKRMAEMLGDDPTGEVCYAVLEDSEVPCGMCKKQGELEVGGAPHVWEYNNRKLGKHLLVTDQIIVWPDGRHVRLELAVDITERKRAHEELRRERDFAEAIVNTAQIIILVLDSEGRIVTFNPYMEELSGYRLEEVEGEDWFTNFLPDEDHDHIREVFKEAVGDIKTMGNRNPIVTKDGEQRIIEWYDKTLRGPDGEAVGLLAIGQDVTERIAAEEKEREYYGIEQASKMKDIFLANMSHELRTPLNSILGFTELIEDELYGPLNDKQKDYISKVIVSSKQLLDLINDILDISKMDANSMHMRKEPFDVPSIVKGVVSSCMDLAKEKALNMRLDLPEEMEYVDGDRKRVMQVLLNLVTNAIKFTPRGGTVTVRSVSVDDHVMLEVSDTGTGMTAEETGLAFRAFWQAKADRPREKGGTGLGLAISKRLVELMGGRICIKSEKGVGTTVSFTLPRGLHG